ncbi:MAG: hypothetical protein M1554_02015 [Patescibacteria group bacterium]|jgi:hypothetical protein|nr:hypothetical protein [Patescibacteria group bacterium]
MYLLKLKPATNYSIYIDQIFSPAGQYLSRHPHLYKIIEEVLVDYELNGKNIVIETKFKKDIGTTDIIPTTPTDNIYYAKAIKSTVFYRFAKNRFPQKSNILTMIIRKDKSGNYEVYDVWIGNNYPALPSGRDTTKKSKDFWDSHALVQDAISIQTKSITKTCPY